MVTAGGGDLQRAARVRLSANVGQVDAACAHSRQRFSARQHLATVEHRADLEQGTRGADLNLRGQCCFGAVAHWHHQLATGLRGGQCCGQYAVDRAQFTGQAQFAKEFVLAQRGQRNLPARGENPQRDWQVEAAAILGQVRGRQVHGDDARREFVLRAGDGSAHAILGFAHRRLGQAHDRHARQAAGQMHLDAHRRRTDARSCTAVHECQVHGGGSVVRRGGAAGRSAAQLRFQFGHSALQLFQLLAGAQQYRALHFKLLARDQVELGQARLQHGLEVLLQFVAAPRRQARRHQGAEAAGESSRWLRSIMGTSSGCGAQHRAWAEAAPSA